MRKSAIVLVFIVLIPLVLCARLEVKIAKNEDYFGKELSGTLKWEVDSGSGFEEYCKDYPEAVLLPDEPFKIFVCDESIPPSGNARITFSADSEDCSEIYQYSYEQSCEDAGGLCAFSCGYGEKGYSGGGCPFTCCVPDPDALFCEYSEGKNSLDGRCESPCPEGYEEYESGLECDERCCVPDEHSNNPNLIVRDVSVIESGFAETNPWLGISLKNIGGKETCLLEASLMTFEGKEVCTVSSNFCLFSGQEWALKCRPDFGGVSVGSLYGIGTLLLMAEADLSEHSDERAGSPGTLLLMAEADPHNVVEESNENDNLLIIEEPLSRVTPASLNPSGTLTASKNSEHGRIYAEDGEEIEFEVTAESSAYPMTSIQLKVVDYKGNEHLSESFRCSGKSCSKSWEILFEFGDHGLYYVYAKINNERGLSSYTEPGGFRVFVDGWESNMPEWFGWTDAYGFDWTTSVKNQGACGSCWAFAALGMLESVYNIEQGNPNLNIDLSEQHLVSCDESNSGCLGGYLDDALNYIKDEGVTEERYFGYESGNLNCAFPQKSRDEKEEHSQIIIDDEGDMATEIYYCDEYEEQGCDSSRCPESPCSRTSCSSKRSDWDGSLWSIESFSDASGRRNMKTSLIKRGPLAVSMVDTYRYSQYYIDRWGFDCQNYDECEDGGHAVALFGFDEDDENCYEPIWKLKNSWGADAGSGDFLRKGYFYINFGECDVESRAVYYVEGVHRL